MELISYYFKVQWCWIQVIEINIYFILHIFRKPLLIYIAVVLLLCIQFSLFICLR